MSNALTKLQDTTITITLRGLTMRQALHCADGAAWNRDMARRLRADVERVTVSTGMLYLDLADQHDREADRWIETAQKMRERRAA